MKKLIVLFCVVAALAVSCNKNECKEKKDADCICTMQYDPVCGCNDKTYSNACEAECNGIKDHAKGECKVK